MSTKLRRVIRPVAILRTAPVVALLVALVTGVFAQSTPLAVTAVGIGPSCPIVGGPASWTATSVGGTAPVEYLFWLRNETAGSWTLLRDYGPANAANWTPATAGVYFTQVWARSAGSPDAWQAWLNSAPCVVTAPTPVRVTSVTATPPSVLVPNPIVWTVGATGGIAPLNYQFWLRNDTAGTWTLLQDYSTASTATWTPTTAGSYFVQAWVRSAGSAAPWEAWGNSLPVAVYLVPPPTTISSVTVTPASPLSLGLPATWAVSASGGVAPLRYQFWLRNETAGTWTLLRDYSTASTAPWTPATAGTYFVQVWVRSAGSAAPWEAWSNSSAVVVSQGPPPPQWTVVVTDPGSRQTIAWPPDGLSSRYRVYRASSRAALLGRLPAAEFFEATAPPLTVNVSNPNVPTYYRVFGLNGSLIGQGGHVAVSTALTPFGFPIFVTPAVWDVDGDGCLDMVGARGTCDGRFEPYPLGPAGLAGLFATGRVNRDSRFADFNGDGRVDIFTNVYAPATDSQSRAILHFGNGTGGFTEDLAIRAMEIGGFGETVVAADFDNDGDIDLFLPHYSHRGDGGHNWLLINDGSGHFTDVAASAGVADNRPNPPPEGAQAIDFNQDGWIDLLVSSHLYINNGNLTFTDQAAAVNLPVRFDEGVKFLDIDMDGDFDLVHHDTFVTRLFKNVGGGVFGGVFDGGSVVDGSPDRTTSGFGLNVCDINGDGFEDVLVANNDLNADPSPVGEPHLLINVGGTLRQSRFVVAGNLGFNAMMACADLDRSGLPDVIGYWRNATSGLRTLINKAGSSETIRLRVLGSGGERNQQGRIVRLQPPGAGGRPLMRVVESGSGYMAQGDYDLLFAAPWPGDYQVLVRFSDGLFQTTARPGDELTIYADHRVEQTAPPLPKLTSVTATPASSGPIGAPVTWSAQARFGVAPLEYRFWLRNETAGTWTILRDYAVASTAAWTPATAGSYFVQVWVRSAGSAAEWEGWLNSSMFVASAPP